MHLRVTILRHQPHHQDTGNQEQQQRNPVIALAGNNRRIRIAPTEISTPCTTNEPFMTQCRGEFAAPRSLIQFPVMLYWPGQRMRAICSATKN